MKTSPLFGLTLALGVALFGGCANQTSQYSKYSTPSSNRPMSFALAVTVQGGLQPSPTVYAAIQEQFADEFAWRGWVLVTDVALADYIVRVDFKPDPVNPDTGTAVVLGVRDNPRRLLSGFSTVSSYPTSFSYGGSFQNALWSPGYANSYYGWSDAYYDGYSYGGPSLTPTNPPTTPTKPPYHHHRPDPGNPENCPPVDPAKPHVPRLPGDFARVPAVVPEVVAASRAEDRARWNRGDRTYTSLNSFAARSGSDGSSSSSSSDRTSWWRNHASSSGDSSSSSSNSDRTYARNGDSGSWRSRSDSSGSSGSSGWSRGGDSGSSRSSDSGSRWGGGDRSSGSSSGWSRSDSGGGGSWHSRSDSGSSSSSYSSSSSSSSSGSSSSSSGSSSSGSSSSGSSSTPNSTPEK